LRSDSAAGTITRSYDGLDRLSQETTPQGTVSYTYDTVGRRTGLTVAGQPAVSYSFDNADRLTQILQGSQTISLAYDTANRRTSLTLPNGAGDGLLHGAPTDGADPAAAVRSRPRPRGVRDPRG
jgi:YD repeat-containing protein